MKNVVYAARDIERALGREPGDDYRIVTNADEYSRTVAEKHPDSVLLVESPAPLDTRELLERPETADFLSKIRDLSVLVFKNTKPVEELRAKKGWRLLNPSAALAEKIENKVTQAEWLGGLSSLLPGFTVIPLKEAAWDKKPLIVQFAHAHTGEGTVLVNSEKELAALRKTFPDRPAKVSEYIKGPVLTMNIAVGNGDETALGNVSYQITGLPPFTDGPFATVGNDWSLPFSLLSEQKLGEFRELALKVADRMRESGWKGLFGIDVIHDEERDELKLLEINARQPASTTFESQLQEKLRAHGVTGSTIFEAHLAALTDSPFPREMIEINDGAQLVQRVTKNVSKVGPWMDLEKAGYTAIPYRNTKQNSDLLRIQSEKGIMEKPGKLNGRGEEIVRILEK